MPPAPAVCSSSVCVIAFTAIGSKYVSTASGQTACQLPDSVGGPGVEVSAIRPCWASHTLCRAPCRREGRRGVKPGRTAQQGENVLNDLPDSAPGVFVVSLAEDDASSPTAYAARIDELRLLLSGRNVYWVTAPGKDRFPLCHRKTNATFRVRISLTYRDPI